MLLWLIRLSDPTPSGKVNKVARLVIFEIEGVYK